MHRNWTRALSLTGNLARRLAVQALVSGTMMVALQAASQMEHTLAGVDWSQLADDGGSFGRSPSLAQADEVVRSGPTAAAHPASAAAVDLAPATRREARLPVPASRDARSHSPSIAEAVLRTRTGDASRAVPTVAVRGAAPASLASETLRFDECHPACESRDPLLLHVAQREPAGPPIYVSSGASHAPSQRTTFRSTQTDGDGVLLEVQAEPPIPTRVGALWNGVLGGWQTARQATGSVVGRIGETVGLLSAEQ
jgi:hypothetical protein